MLQKHSWFLFRSTNIFALSSNASELGLKNKDYRHGLDWKLFHRQGGDACRRLHSLVLASYVCFLFYVNILPESTF